MDPGPGGASGRRWIRPANRIAAQRTYYDGNSGARSRFGPAIRPGSKAGSTEPDGWTLERKDYDEFGNVIAIYDGEYRSEIRRPFPRSGL